MKNGGTIRFCDRTAAARPSDRLESLKGKTCCRQVKFYSGVSPLTSRWSCLSRILARRLNPAVLHPARSNCRIPLAGLRRRLASSPNFARPRPTRRKGRYGHSRPIKSVMPLDLNAPFGTSATKGSLHVETALHSGLSPFGWSPLLSPLTGGRSLGVAGSLPARTKRFFSGDVACVSKPNESCDEPEPVAPAVQGLPERRRSTLRRERYPVIPRARI